jgi:hypothetical protein
LRTLRQPSTAGLPKASNIEAWQTRKFCMFFRAISGNFSGSRESACSASRPFFPKSDSGL